MESRRTTFLPAAKSSDVDAARPYQRQLLPFEWQLIEALGISEQEYASHCEELILRASDRSSAYARIPDIRNEPISLTTILVNVAIGAVLSGVGMLLAPKPSNAEQRKIKQGEAVNLGGQTGRERFNNPIGFDSLPQLAELGSPIPIVWGRYKKGPKDNSRDDLQEQDPNPDEASGGMVAEPLTVWSRLTSEGSFQTLHVIGVVGDGPIRAPQLRGIMLGGQPLNSIYQSSYSVYWLEGEGLQEFNNNDLIFGEPEKKNQNLPFGVPTGQADLETQSCMAFTPASNTSFGVYESYANLGEWKPNWEIIPFPRLVGQSDNRNNYKELSRRKIAGKDAEEQDDGMKGTGRVYNRLYGLTKILDKNGKVMHDPEWSVERKVEKDEIVVLTINDVKLKEEYYYGDSSDDDRQPEYEDVIQKVDNMRYSIDDAMVNNSIWLCNQTLLRCERPPGQTPFLLGNGNMEIRLRVVDFIGPSRLIGLAGSAPVTGVLPANPNLGPVKAVFPYVLFEGGTGGRDGRFCRNSTWYPIQKVDLGVIKNTKACEATEIGIRSQVWGRLNGLCNFPTIPEPSDLEDLETDVGKDENGDTIQNGYNNLYFERTSFFQLGIKNLTEGERGVSNSGDEKDFKDDLFGGFDIIEECIFCITGRAPVDQYNWIRIVHGGILPTQLEYRLLPVPAINMYLHRDKAKPLYRLDADGKLFSKPVVSSKYNSQYVISFKAREIILPMVENSSYFASSQSKTVTIDLGSKLDINGVIVDHTDANANKGFDEKMPRKMAWMSKFFGPTRPVNGNPTSFNGARFNRDKTVFGEKHTYTRILTSTDGKFEVEVTGTCTMQDARDIGATMEWWDQYEDFKIWHQSAWKFNRLIKGADQITKLPVSFKVKADNLKEYFWGKKNKIDSVSMKVTLTGAYQDLGDQVVVKDYERLWDRQTGYQEVYTYQEVSTSCDSSPEHSISYVNEITRNLAPPSYGNLAMLGLKVRAINQTQNLTQIQCWLAEGVKAENLLNTSVNESSANLAELMHYLLTKEGRGLQEEVHPLLVDRDQFEKTGKYLNKLKLRFDGSIVDAVSYREYFAAVAPYFMCHLTTNNGKFSLVPALPYNPSSGEVVTGPLTPRAVFNNGNIIEDSFKLEYFPLIDRRDVRAIVKYRNNTKYSLTDYLSFQLQYRTTENGTAWNTPIQQEFDLTAFCSKGAQAQLTGRYLLSTRRRIDHQITFKTSPYGLKIGPGDFIQLLDTQLAALRTRANAVVQADGSLLTAEDLPADGEHFAFVYRQGSTELSEETIELISGKVTDMSLVGSMINIPNIQDRYGFYQVVQISLDEDFMVEIKANHHPVNAKFESKIVKDILVHPQDRFAINARF